MINKYDIISRKTGLRNGKIEATTQNEAEAQAIQLGYTLDAFYVQRSTQAAKDRRKKVNRAEEFDILKSLGDILRPTKF